MTTPPQLDKRQTAARPPAPNSHGERRRAVRNLAARAHDAADLAQLLDLLGLDPQEGRRMTHPEAPE